jgi:hypothetical protein
VLVVAVVAVALAAALLVRGLGGSTASRVGAGDTVAADARQPTPTPAGSPTPTAPVAAEPVTPGPATPGPVPVAAPPGVAEAALPTRVRIPAIGVESPLVALGLTADGALEVPTDFAVAGWFTGGSVPGAPGPAVLAGHVDSRSGPAVFYRLRELAPGDVVEVDRTDGSAARFRVERVEQYPKGDFPTGTVYGPAPGAQLRLITCGGIFDRSVAHYRDNVVVYAVGA